MSRCRDADGEPPGSHAVATPARSRWGASVGSLASEACAAKFQAPTTAGPLTGRPGVRVFGLLSQFGEARPALFRYPQPVAIRTDWIAVDWLNVVSSFACPAASLTG